MTLYGQEHIDRYVATDGKEGHDWQGTQTLILTTTGRRSGEPRRHALIYGRHDHDYLVVASKGGRRTTPRGTSTSMRIQRLRSRSRATRCAHARTAAPEEKAELWPIMTKEWPDYDRYQENTDRDIPVVVLAPQ